VFYSNGGTHYSRGTLLTLRVRGVNAWVACFFISDDKRRVVSQRNVGKWLSREARYIFRIFMPFPIVFIS